MIVNLKSAEQLIENYEKIIDSAEGYLRLNPHGTFNMFGKVYGIEIIEYVYPGEYFLRELIGFGSTLSCGLCRDARVFSADPEKKCFYCVYYYANTLKFRRKYNSKKSCSAAFFCCGQDKSCHKYSYYGKLIRQIWDNYDRIYRCNHLPSFINALKWRVKILKKLVSKISDLERGERESDGV